MTNENSTENEINEITNILQAITEAWSTGHPGKLDTIFHNDIMIVSPELKVYGAGKATCIQSYVDFLNHATVLDFKYDEPEIHIFDNTATAFCPYEFSWETKGELHKEKGKEMYIFNKNNGKWLIVMKKLIPKG